MSDAAVSQNQGALVSDPAPPPWGGRRRSKCRPLMLGLVPLVCWFSLTKTMAQNLESVPPGEEQAINTIVALALGELQKRYPAGAPLVRRDAHAKAHGCVKAIFRVDDNLTANLRVGTFSTPGQEFRAWVRYSNGAFEPGADTGMDGRGMAVKILEPPSPGLSSPPAPGEGPAAAATTHDILMINYPVFFSPDAVDYADFAKSGALTGDSSGLRRYFVPSFINPLRWRVRQGLIAFNIASQKISSPLAIQYFSMVPFLFGPGRAVKYSARPCQAAPEQRRASDSSGPDFLRAVMQEDLSRGPACFELMVQERQSGMPIEDATVEWSQSASSFRRVGVLSIQQQQFQTPERTAFCESTAFTPWNASPDHRPLGSINRVRKVLYEKISSERHNRNSAPLPDPLVAWERL